MKPIERIMVGLDRTDLDPTLIRYAKFLAQNSAAKEVYFVNILKNFDIPDEVQKEFPKLIQNAIDDRKQEIAVDLESYFTLDGIDTRILVDRASSGTRVFLKALEKYKIDLLILGRKRNMEGSGILVQRLARRAGANLLIVPEGSDSKLDKEPPVKQLLVPVDFSKHSALAVRQAVDIGSRMNQKVKIICVNAYKVPVGYHYTGKSFEEFSGIMKKHAQRNYREFIKNIDTKGLDVSAKYVLDKKEDFVAVIYEYATKVNVDGIIFGAKGRTSASALFLGSIAEKLIRLDTEFPLLVVREKGENAGFLDYIMDI